MEGGRSPDATVTREVRLGGMTEREKDTAILVLAGYSRRMKALLEELSEKNGYARHRLDQLLKEYEPRLGFLERTYSRTVLAPRDLARDAARNDQIWTEVEVR